MDEAALNDLLIDQTTAGTYLLNIIRNTDSKRASNITPEYLNKRITRLEELWKEIKDNNKILQRNKQLIKDEIYFTKDAFLIYEDSYTTSKIELERRIRALLPAAAPVTTSQAQDNGEPRTVFVQTPPTYVSLPMHELPSFSGKQADWESFKSRFNAKVRNVHSISSVDKLEHLMSCVKGEAESCIKNLDITDANFEVAWKALESRYDNRRLRLSAHLRRLLTMQHGSSKSAAEIRRLIDDTNESIRALSLLGRPVEHWDDWFIELILNKLDASTREAWENSLDSETIFPTFADFSTFLERKARSLASSQDLVTSVKQQMPNSNTLKKNKPQSLVTAHQTTTSSSQGPNQQSRPPKGCSLCKGNHFIAHCPAFINLCHSSKLSAVIEAKLCRNCLRTGHYVKVCNSPVRCKENGCNGKHHTLLHGDGKAQHGSPRTTLENSTNQEGSDKSGQTVSITSCSTKVDTMPTVFLATARVTLRSYSGNDVSIRALIDPASEGTFISERVAQNLRLKRKSTNTAISGVGGEVHLTSMAVTNLFLVSRVDTNFTLSFTALIISRPTSLLPRKQVPFGNWPHLEDLELADPDFNTPGTVDCILGADLYSTLIRQGVRAGQPGEPVAQETALGWIITGPTGSGQDDPRAEVRAYHTRFTSDMQRFWEVEEVPSRPILTKKEEECETHFLETHFRDATGRYVLRLPFEKQLELPGSKAIATARFLQNEKRLLADQVKREAYNKFMAEFIELGHMELVPSSEEDNEQAYYMPDHAVTRQDGSGRVRVVFNASQKAFNNVSLNDCLHLGPKLQADITTIICRWRFHRYVVKSDIVKMFRQFRIHPDDTNWLRILWRNSPTEQLRSYRMLTVVYGTKPAPYLAIRALRQLAQDEKINHPKGAKTLLEKTYVDDIFDGADTIEEALEVQKQLIDILGTAGMSLDKWAANNELLLPQATKPSTSNLSLSDPDIVSTLGLQWNPKSDTFCFYVALKQEKDVVTKRSMLSEIAQLYDPLGWLAPTIIVAKLLMQQLWIQGLDWDQEVDEKIVSIWREWRHQLAELENLRIPRWLGTYSNSSYYLHGFSDASQRAYSAVIYLVTKTNDESPQVTLLMAKTKVAPLKTLSIPRLELLGATLLARLFKHVLTELKLSVTEIFCWTDSTVTMAWLSDHPARWNTFVANKTSEILTSLPTAQWNHVRSRDNPADVASRGILPTQLLNEQLWWTGPSWLIDDFEEWPKCEKTYRTELEERKSFLTFATQLVAESSPIEELISRFSSLRKLLRAIAYLLRWKESFLQRKRHDNLQNNSSKPGIEELIKARTVLVRSLQEAHFSSEKQCLLKGKNIPIRSRVRRLLPFIDADGILRVGGRLQNSYLVEGEKHPIIVPGNCFFSKLLIQDAHQRTHHGGPQLVMSVLQREFWITRARNQIKIEIKRCSVCKRYQARKESQQMAPLPAVRVTPALPFYSTGLDYAGPFRIRTTKGRGHKAYKGYVAIFICMVTRAIHIEAVSDYSTKAFLQAFRRFTSRRSTPSIVYSDNGTAFQGASNELKNLFDETTGIGQEIADAVANDGVKWSFIPPRAPHFGGLWEAGVKSFKHHLHRAIGDATLTFEEFSTLLCQIEACLNSRPLAPLSSDPQDLAALTPGHFLVGKALVTFPEPYTNDKPEKMTDRYALITKMRNYFWDRWRKEVLRQMQHRIKWIDPQTNIKPGDLVIITDELQLPSKWPLARVLECAPGGDGLVRAVKLKTATSVFDRPIAKLIKLAIEEDPTTTDS